MLLFMWAKFYIFIPYHQYKIINKKENLGCTTPQTNTWIGKYCNMNDFASIDIIFI